MKNRIQWKLGLLAGVLLATLVGCGKTEQKRPTLEGRWSGFDANVPSVKLTAMFNAGRFTYWDAQTNELGNGTYLVNDTVQPAQMDLIFEACPAPAYVGKKALAIYEFQGEQLRIAGNQPGNLERPTNFVGSQTIQVFSWKRE